ncbi:hypothetical protein VTH82DRAFT_3165 [Thermothelomyces myriococcoides]
MEGMISSATKVILRPPPLHVTASACRLFRHVYRKVAAERLGRPPLSSPGLPCQLGARYLPRPGPLHQVLRIWRRTLTTSSLPRTCSTSCTWNPPGKTLNILFPVADLEKKHVDPAWGKLQLEPVLVPIDDERRFSLSSFGHANGWFYTKFAVEHRMRQCMSRNRPNSEEQRALWERTWRLCPAPELKACLVDKRRLNDHVVSGLSRRLLE